MGTYDRLQAGLCVMSQGDGESKRHGHGPAPEYKGETATHAMTMPRFYMVTQLKYTGSGFTKQASIDVQVCFWKSRRPVGVPNRFLRSSVQTAHTPCRDARQN